MGNMLKKEEYEFYKIPFPLKKLLEKKRKNFFYSELEKRHPCFSSLCAFDYKFKLGRRGMESDVIVMNRLKLAEMKKQPGFKGVSIPEFKRRFFVPKEIQQIILFILFLIFSVLSIFFIRLYKNQNTENFLINSEIENLVLSENLNSDLEEIKNEKDYLSLEKEILDTVNYSGGKINSFEWKLSDGYESVNASIENMYPERLDKINSDYFFNSRIIYKVSVPFFTIEARKRIPFTESFSSEENKFDGQINISEAVSVDEYKNSLLKEIRNLFFEYEDCNLCLQEENPGKNEFNFLLSKQNNLAKDFFTKVNQICHACNFFVSGFSLESKDEIFFQIQLSFCLYNEFFSSSFIESAFIDDLIHNLDIFGFISIEDKPVVKERLIVEKNPVDDSDAVMKIGEVKYKNGRKKTYYKNKEGKIISIEN